MPRVSPYLVPYAQNAWANTLPESATVVRTGAQVNCRLSDDQGNQRMPGVPLLLALRRWKITVPVGTDIRCADHIDISGRGTYIAIILENPTSYDVLYGATAVKGEARMIPLLARFERPQDGEAPLAIPNTGNGTVPLALYPAALDSHVVEYAAQYEWGLMWDSSYTFADGSLPAAGDWIVHPDFKGGRQQLRHVRATFGQSGPLTCYVQEVQ